MKLLPILCASVVILSGVTLSQASESGSINYNASKSNTGNVTAKPTPKCSTGQVWNTTGKRCAPISAVNYNSSKSNTGNVTATPLNNRQNVTGSAPPK
jgi:hypothetical protein